MDVLQLRKQIPACQTVTYLNTGWSGPSPLPVVKVIKDWLDYEMVEGPTSPDVYLEGQKIIGKTREAVAGLVNAAPEEICVTRNTTEGLNIVINGLRWNQGDEIITCDLEHSSVLIPSYFQQYRHGVVVRVVSMAPDEGRETILEKIESAISDRTRMVFLSHVEYSSGLRMPVKEIRQLTGSRGVLLLLDGAQSVGQVPLDMADLGCDFYSMPSHKWLLGPEGVGALYVRRELIPQLEPTYVASRSAVPRSDPYGFEPKQDSIDKFLLTSTSVPLQAGLLEAIEFMRAVGIEEVQARNLDLAGTMKEALSQTPGVKVLSPFQREISCGIVSIALDGISPQDAVAQLWENHRIVCRQVDFPPSIRLSLHFFNTEEEVAQLVDAVKELTRR